MSESILTYIMLYLLFSVALIWETSLAMLKKRKITPFLPFLLLGILASFQAASIFYDLFEKVIWGFIEFAFMANLIWVFAILRKKQNE